MTSMTTMLLLLLLLFLLLMLLFARDNPKPPVKPIAELLATCLAPFIIHQQASLLTPYTD